MNKNMSCNPIFSKFLKNQDEVDIVFNKHESSNTNFINYSYDVQVELRSLLLKKISEVNIIEYKTKPQSFYLQVITQLVSHYATKGLMPSIRLSADLFIAIILIIYATFPFNT